MIAYLFLGSHKNSLNAQVSIPPGASLTQIGRILDSQDVVTHWFIFAVAAKISGEGSRIQSGIYKFPSNMRVFDVVSSLSAGRYQVQVWITFPEGITVRGIANLLHTKLGIDPSLILTLSQDRAFRQSLGIDAPSLEGYLFPETYLCKLDDTPRKILAAMVQLFKKNIGTPLISQIRAQKKSLHAILTMGSIVEGETKKAGERARVAGVYYNRLKRGMLLQADPTVQYIIADGPRRLFYKDLRIDSPYNTYLYRGLPPGPINNPGKAAVLAAMFPESHNYLYFVADGTGGHRFSRNYTEHAAAVAAYRKFLSAQSP